MYMGLHAPYMIAKGFQLEKMCVSSYLWPADQQAVWVSSLSLQNRLVVSEELAGASLYLWRELTARPSELWALVPPSFILYKTNHLIYHPADPSGSIWLTAINPNLTMDLKRGKKLPLEKATAIIRWQLAPKQEKTVKQVQLSQVSELVNLKETANPFLMKTWEDGQVLVRTGPTQPSVRACYLHSKSFPGAGFSSSRDWDLTR